MASLRITQSGIDMIVGFEVTSPEVYEKKYRNPIWPGGASGVTIGIGYDLGYYNYAQVSAHWGKYVSPEMLKAMLSVRGLKGLSAKAQAAAYKDRIDIPYNIASKVFAESTLPDFAEQTKDTWDGIEKLHPYIQDSMLSLCYNRGSDTDPQKDRRKEMHQLKALIKVNDVSGIAKKFREMKRLWPKVKGLRDRRDKEADHVMASLTISIPEADKLIISV